MNQAEVRDKRHCHKDRPASLETRTPFSAASPRHELGRLAIQETNKASTQTAPPEMNKNNPPPGTGDKEAPWKETAFFPSKAFCLRE
jgi:hypothetical protein